MYKIGIDLGGTNIAVGVVDENFNIVGRGKVKTNCPRPAEEIVADMVLAAEMAMKDAGITVDQVDGIGVGSPGAINSKDGIVETLESLPGASWVFGTQWHPERTVGKDDYSIRFFEALVAEAAKRQR